MASRHPLEVRGALASLTCNSSGPRIIRAALHTRFHFLPLVLTVLRIQGTATHADLTTKQTKAESAEQGQDK